MSGEPLDDTRDFPILECDESVVRPRKRKPHMLDLRPVKKLRLDTSSTVRAEVYHTHVNINASSPTDDTTFFPMDCDQSTIYSFMDDTTTGDISETKHKCPSCESAFTYKYSLTHHIKFRCGQEYKCKTCHKIYKSNSGYTYHLKHAHQTKMKISKKFRGNQHTVMKK